MPPPLASQNISYEALSRTVNESGKVIGLVDPHPHSDRHQNVIASRGPSLAHAYRTVFGRPPLTRP